MTDHADVLLRSFVNCRFVNLRLDERRHFDEVVTRRFRFAYGLARFFRRVDDEIVSLFAPCQMWARDKESWRLYLAISGAAAQRQQLGSPYHEPDRRDAVGHHHAELVRTDRIGKLIAV